MSSNLIESTNQPIIYNDDGNSGGNGCPPTKLWSYINANFTKRNFVKRTERLTESAKLTLLST